MAKTVFMTLVLAAAVLLGGCAQTSVLWSPLDKRASATVQDPILPGDAHITVVLDGKTYSGVEGESYEDTTGEQALRFGWKPEHKHPNIKQEMDFFFGSTTLVASDGSRLSCDYLHHGDDWRLLCKTPVGGEVALQRIKR